MVTLKFFIDINLSDPTMALKSTQPLTEMSNPGVFPGGKCGQCIRLTNLPPFCAVVKKSGNLNFLDPSGTLQACNGTALTLLLLLQLSNQGEKIGEKCSTHGVDKKICTDFEPKNLR
jgi:hypothetical protein